MGGWSKRRALVAGLAAWLLAATHAAGQFCNRADELFSANSAVAAGDRPSSVSIGDLDGDGDLDMAVANFTSDDTSVLLNNGDGTFAAQTRYDAGNGPWSVSLGDLDGDGDLDMAVANSALLDGGGDDMSVLLNNGDGTFAAQTRYAAGDNPTSVSLGDLDGDGDLDMAVANASSADASVLLNNGDGTFAAQTRYAVGDGPRSVSLGDLDGDGDLDMAVANSDSADVSVLLNQCDASGPCNAADFAEPFGVLDLADVTAFVTAFTAQNPAADLAEPLGVLDLADLVAFVTAFGAGCP